MTNKRHSKKTIFVQSISLTDMLFVFLALSLLVTALAVVYTKHLSRFYFVELQQQAKIRDDLGVEWSQLLLEQGAWGAQSRIEKIAEDKLNMHMPKKEKVVVLKT